MPPQKPITGDNLFTTESGIIAGWWSRLEELNMPLEMFPFLPSFVGYDGKVNVVLGKKSGRDSITFKAKKLNFCARGQDRQGTAESEGDFRREEADTD